MSLKAVETDAADLTDELGDLMEDVDIASVDLAMDPLFELRVMANQRIGLVKEANLVRLSMAANKLVNPTRYDELRKHYQQTVWQVALIDKRYPGAKALSMAMMARIAAAEAAAEQQG